jgi:SpoVK/Ycf46/Vps4 family AAA+-type ATPase
VKLPNHALLLDVKFKIKELEPEAKKDDGLPDFIPVEPVFSFDQMILTEDVKNEVLDALKSIECQDLIYNVWGFGEIDPTPKCVVNMYGEAGTGKTMCAHAMAKHLGKKILLLNYADIESKYVGDAPKNLKKAFDVAKATDAVMFFDEADSFLGKRIQNVSHGSDQALNSLRSQMLILLEDHKGVVLFATNLVTNFDKAFQSRMLKSIKFELPNEEARALIIKGKIPPRLPVVERFAEGQPFSDEVYLEASKLIEGFSGREIRNAVLDLLLKKAQPDGNVLFSEEDVLDAFRKKKEEKDRLENERMLIKKEKIMNKLMEDSLEEKAKEELESEKKKEDVLDENPSLEFKPEEVEEKNA